jgi:DNA-binding transcriptional MerR regulator
MMRIGEAAAAAGMTTKTLRFYEDSGLLPAAKRSCNGYRDYTEDSVARLEFIRRGRAAGLALTKIREILGLRDAGEAPCAHVQDLLSNQLADLDHQIAELIALRSVVAGLHANAAAGTDASCDPGRICSYL